MFPSIRELLSFRSIPQPTQPDIECRSPSPPSSSADRQVRPEANPSQILLPPQGSGSRQETPFVGSTAQHLLPHALLVVPSIDLFQKPRFFENASGCAAKFSFNFRFAPSSAVFGPPRASTAFHSSASSSRTFLPPSPVLDHNARSTSWPPLSLPSRPFLLIDVQCT